MAAREEVGVTQPASRVPSLPEPVSPHRNRFSQPSSITHLAPGPSSHCNASSDLSSDRGRQYFQNKKLPELPQRKPPTPGPSPEPFPVLDSQLRDSKSIDFFNKAVCKDIRRQLAETSTWDQSQLRMTPSLPSLAPSSSRLSLSSSMLQEPDFNDFLNLSDDDIAETSPENWTPDQNATAAHSTAPSITESPRQSLLILPPSYPSQPATAAAFETARIADRYNFDLVYVVNLWWPENSRPRSSGPDLGDAASVNSNVSAKPSRGMTGRLLAAYGLHNVNSPFQISAIAHGKILQSPGWIEHRNQEARDGEFAQGYACSFYTGQYSRNGAPSSSISSARSAKTDRGIVFAAYRKPSVDGSLAGVGSSQVDLVSIYKDAKALVEMLIDIHVANRLSQPLSGSPGSDETGSMPEQRAGVI